MYKCQFVQIQQEKNVRICTPFSTYINTEIFSKYKFKYVFSKYTTTFRNKKFRVGALQNIFSKYTMMKIGECTCPIHNTKYDRNMVTDE